MTECCNPGPLTLRISVTERCQLRCAYCSPPDGMRRGGRRTPRPHASSSAVIFDRTNPPAQRAGGTAASGGELSFDAIVRFVRVVQSRFGLAGGRPSTVVRLTGGEPLLRPRLDALIEMLAAEGVRELALTTNGQLLHEAAPTLARAGLSRVNVSLDSLKPSVFEELTRGGDLRRTLRGLDTALACGLQPVKTNTVLLRGINDGEVIDLVRFGLASNCQVRFLELMPIGIAQSHFEHWFVPASEPLARIAAEFDLQPVGADPRACSQRVGAGPRTCPQRVGADPRACPQRVGAGPRACPQSVGARACASGHGTCDRNGRQAAPTGRGTSRNYLVRDDAGRSTIVGFIAPCSQPFCDGCRRLRLTSSGRLLGCLAQRHGRNIRPLLDSPGCDDSIAAAICDALLVKQRERRFQQQHAMAAIGG